MNGKSRVENKSEVIFTNRKWHSAGNLTQFGLDFCPWSFGLHGQAAVVWVIDWAVGVGIPQRRRFQALGRISKTAVLLTTYNFVCFLYLFLCCSLGIVITARPSAGWWGRRLFLLLMAAANIPERTTYGHKKNIILNYNKELFQNAPPTWII